MSRVMIAESSPSTRKRIEKLLEAEALDFESVSDGVEAYESLRHSTPDLILMDAVMPGPDGGTLLEKVRQHREDVPVLLITAKNQLMMAKGAFASGAMDFISKPVDMEELRVRVHRALAARETVPTLKVPLGELHDPATGRIDARRVAEFLGVSLAKVAEALSANYQTVYKTPCGPDLQQGLRPIKSCLELVSRFTRSKADLLAWLNNPHPDLRRRTPLDLLLAGQSGAIITLLKNAFSGIPR